MYTSGATQWVLNMDKIYYTFDDYMCDIENIADLVHESNFDPDVIVGIERGGNIPAVHLSHTFDKPFLSFAFSTRDNRVIDDKNFDKLLEILNADSKILFIDDINDTGETFKQILTCLAKHNVPGDFYKFASLVYNKNSIMESDFYGMVIEKIDDSPWVQFWWEKENA